MPQEVWEEEVEVGGREGVCVWKGTVAVGVERAP